MGPFKNLSFTAKIAGALFGLSLALSGASGLFYYYNIYNTTLRQMGERLTELGRTGAYLFEDRDRKAIVALRKNIIAARPVIPAAELAALPEDDVIQNVPKPARARIMNGPNFQRLVQIMRRIKEGSRRSVIALREKLPQQLEDPNDPPLVRFVYLVAPIPESPDMTHSMFIADTDYEEFDENGDGIIQDDESGNPAGTVWVSAPEFIAAYKSGQAAASREWYTDAWGTWYSAAVPIKDADGNILAILGLDYDIRGEANLLNYYWNVSVGLIIAGLVFAFVLSFVFARMLSFGILELTKGVEALGEGNFDTQVQVRSGDEIGRLGRAFNEMVSDLKAGREELNSTLEQLRERSEELAAMNTAIERFVPREFLRNMGHDSVRTVNLGDQVLKEMTVMFCDIRSFTAMSEEMSPEENFEFLNEYLKRLSPIIRENRGFIDKYIGDAVMALFPGEARDGLLAGVQMMMELALFNADRSAAGLGPVRFGIGLHLGKLMLGTVGEDERMDGTVISDAVNVAARLESLTKHFGVTMIVSESVLEAARQGQEVFESRYMGEIRVKGRTTRVPIHEILDGLPAMEREGKVRTRASFEEAIRLTKQKDYAGAASVLEKVVAENPTDRAAQVFHDKLMAVAARAAMQM